MTGPSSGKRITALHLIDAYSEFISAGGLYWDRLKSQ